MSDPRYPIGKFAYDGPPDAEQRHKLIDDIEQSRSAMSAADVQSTPLEVSLSLLDALHDRWVRLLRSLEPHDWKRVFNHPELGTMPLEKNLALYSWHGRHHVAHITELRKKMGWS